MSVIDAHCHVWERWPYDPPVPDPESRARAEQLLYEMDRNAVDHSVIICASIGKNASNTDYAFDAADRHPSRFTVFPDIECRWASSYHSPGAAARLREAVARWPMKGFAHYLEEKEDGSWLTSGEGVAFFGLAEDLGLIASLSVLPHQMPQVRRLARACPNLKLLCHHYAHLGPRSGEGDETRRMVVDAADQPNIFIKLSGIGNIAAQHHEYPYTTLDWVTEAIVDAFGTGRLLWGSDYPVSRRHITYTQSKLLIERHARFSATDLKKIMGGTFDQLLHAD